jgi:hypothetical protein
MTLPLMLSTFICREGSASTGTPTRGPFRFSIPRVSAGDRLSCRSCKGHDSFLCLTTIDCAIRHDYSSRLSCPGLKRLLFVSSFDYCLFHVKSFRSQALFVELNQPHTLGMLFTMGYNAFITWSLCIWATAADRLTAFNSHLLWLLYKRSEGRGIITRQSSNASE